MALAGGGAFVQRSKDGDRHGHAGASITKRQAGFDRNAAFFASDADRASGGLSDHVEGEVLLVGATGAEAFDLAVDDAGVDGLHIIVAKTEALDRAWRHVLYAHIGLAQQILHQLQSTRR